MLLLRKIGHDERLIRQFLLLDHLEAGIRGS